MTNREKYANEMRIALSQNTFAEFYDKYIHPAYRSGEFHSLHHHERAIYTILWLSEEYIEPEPEVDWSKVAVDTPVLVRCHEVSEWERRYFAEFKDGKVYVWGSGRTSWSGTDKSCWNYAKLAVVENE